jgi:hypothetical protein
MASKRTRRSHHRGDGAALAVWAWVLLLLGVFLVGGGVLGAFAVPDWSVLLLAAGFVGGTPCIVLGVLAAVLSRVFDAIHCVPMCAR